MSKKQKKISIKTTKGKTIPAQPATPAIWNPFDMLTEVNRLFTTDPWIDPTLRHFGWHRPWAGLWLGSDIKEVPIDIIDAGEEFKIVAEMPGIAKEDIEITVTPNNISICGKTEAETKEKQEGYIRQERSYSTLCRNMMFPTEVNPDNAEANLKDGILEIKVQKKEQDKGKHRTIPVK